MTGQLILGQLPPGQLPTGQLPRRTSVLEPFLLDNIRDLPLNHVFMDLWTCKGCNVRSECLYKIRFKLLIISLHIANPSFYKPKYSTQTLIQNFKLCFIVEQISGKIWHNRGFNDKSVKTSEIVHLDLLNKIGYEPIA